MELLERLARGEPGAQVSFPAELERRAYAGPGSVMLVDPVRQVGWFPFLFPLALDLDERFEGQLRSEAERDARAIFEAFAASLPAAPGFQPAPPRTRDPSWSPIVELSSVRIGEAPALQVIHRLAYQPGREDVMGHLLIPLAQGLLELRVLAQARSTGLRESTLMAKAMSSAPAGTSPALLMKALGQAHYDQPEHDGAFPDHPLSQVRSALAWLRHESGLLVRSPAPLYPPGEQVFEAWGFGIAPPPRYALAVQDPGGPVQFSKLTFSGNDCVHLLSIWPQPNLPGRDGSQEALRKALHAMGEESFPDRARDRQLQLVELPPGDPCRLLAHLRFHDGGEARHNLLGLFFDAFGRAVLVALSGPASTPDEAYLADVRAAASSYRSLRPPSASPAASPKPWWRFW